MLLGYARVSKDGQDQIAQVRGLEGAGCNRIFRERASGGRWERPDLHRLLDQLRRGDVIVVWKLDRLSRSLKDLLHLMERIEEKGAGFRSLTETVDTTTAAGRMLMQMVGAFAEFERSMIREGTRAGLAAARENGRIGGRPRKLNGQQRKAAVELVSSGTKTAAANYLDFNLAFIGQLGWAQAATGQVLSYLDDASDAPAAPMTAWNHALLEEPAFQEHLAIRFLNTRQVGNEYRSLAEQAADVLDRVDASIDQFR